MYDFCKNFEMASSKTISVSKCLELLKEIIDDTIRPKKEKLGSYENVREILQKSGVHITQKPTEKVRKIYKFYFTKGAYRNYVCIAEMPLGFQIRVGYQ